MAEEKASMGHASRPLGGLCALFFTCSAAQTGKDGGSVGEREKGEREKRRRRRERGRRGGSRLFLSLNAKGPTG